MSELNVRERLTEKVLKAYGEKYQELTQTWDLIDTKAQGTTAIAGIFIAGAFAFATQIKSAAPIWWKVFFPLLLVVLIFSIFKCISAMRVRKTNLAPTGIRCDEMAKDLLDNITDDKQLESRIPNFHIDLFIIYREAIKSSIELLEVKAKHLKAAQMSLSISIIISAILTCLMILL